MRALIIALIGFALASAAPVFAEEPQTRIGKEGFESPPATLDQLDWLVGQWSGEGIDGATAIESWLPEIGGTMVGTFVQETANGEVMFTEHMYITAQDGSLALKLKHFNADLTGWEEKDDMITFRLVAIEPCAAYFNGLTLRCDGQDGLVAAVRMQSGGELGFRFERMPSTDDGSNSGSCADAYTTIDMNQCLAGLLETADFRRSEYLEVATQRHNDRPELVAQITAADEAFAAYRDSECGAVYEDWKSGTIRGVMSLSCRIDMTDKRTLTIWENWLTYADSTPPILPKPVPTR